MPRENCCSRDDYRDIGSHRDPINKLCPTTTTDDHNATGRDEDDDEGRNRAVEVVLPPPSPKVRARRLGMAMG
jgi:hypothetical protein